MTLSQSTLKAKLFKVFVDMKTGKIRVSNPPVPPPPLMSSEAAAALAGAYDDWIKESIPMAGPLTVIIPGQRSLLQAALILTPMMAGWTPGLIAYWTPVTWGKNPGFVPVNPTVPVGLAALAPSLAVMLFSMSITSDEDAADKIATLLATYTKTVTVAAVTTAGVPTVFPIM